MDKNYLPQRIALCLSGGGYRAMLFHVGALWRLYETGFLARISLFSSVSGGSIASGFLGLQWHSLGLHMPGERDLERFINLYVVPMKQLAEQTIDLPAILRHPLAILGLGNASQEITKAYRDHLFGDATLQDLPQKTAFIFNATNVQSGASWRFSRRVCGDYRVGLIDNPNIRLADAVAASSAFPPFLSPAIFHFEGQSFRKTQHSDLSESGYQKRVVLTDGGVYDNLGLEAALNSRMILVSDGGGKWQPAAKRRGNWASHLYDVFGVTDDQVRSLRKRMLISRFRSDDPAQRIRGTYWSIRSDVASYDPEGVLQRLPCDPQHALQLAEVPTRLKAMPASLQERLINWGYAICDLALRRHIDKTLSPPVDFPYPDQGI